MPAITPASGGAPEANAMPKQSGNATKKTTTPEAKFCLNKRQLFLSRIILETICVDQSLNTQSMCYTNNQIF